MGRLSSIQRLPSEVREEISRLREQHTLDEILAHLRTMGGPAAEVSRSALGRHVKTLEKATEQLRRSRMLAESIGRTLGDASESQVASLNVQLLHSLINDVLMDAADEDAEEGSDGAAARAMLRNPKAAALFAEAVDRLTKASRTNVEFLAKVEERAARKAVQQAAKAAETVAKSRGLSAETLDAIRAGILGVKQ
jgi:hypothetical protein